MLRLPGRSPNFRRGRYEASRPLLRRHLRVRDPGRRARRSPVRRRESAIGPKDADAAETIRQLNAGWYYTWNTEPIESAGSAQFVPMIWSDGAKMDRQVAQLEKGPTPCAAAGLQRAGRAAPGRHAGRPGGRRLGPAPPLARRIGSPAAVNALGPWFEGFAARMAEQGKDYDFVAVHWYGAPSAKSFLRKIDDIHDTYKKPIWITEFAVSDWAARDGRKSRYSTEATERFMTDRPARAGAPPLCRALCLDGRRRLSRGDRHLAAGRRHRRADRPRPDLCRVRWGCRRIGHHRAGLHRGRLGPSTARNRRRPRGWRRSGQCGNR